MKRGRPTYATVAAALAILTTLSGTAYAALLITSKDIVDGSIKLKDLHTNSVGSTQVRDGSLTLADLAGTTKRSLGAGHSLVLDDISSSIGSDSLTTGPTVASLVLPAGRFLVSGTVAISGTRSLECHDDPNTQTGSCSYQRITTTCRVGVGERTPEQLLRVSLRGHFEDDAVLPFDLQVSSGGSASVDLRCSITKAVGASGAAYVTEVRMNAVSVL